MQAAEGVQQVSLSMPQPGGVPFPPEPRFHGRVEDGSLGWVDRGPYDAVLVTDAPQRIPQVLLDQLADDGRILIALGPPMGRKTLWLVRKVGGGWAGVTWGT